MAPSLPSLPPRRRLVLLLAAIAVLVIGAVVYVVGEGDGDGAAPRPDRAVADAAYQRLLPGLCQAAAFVGRRDVRAAHEVFVDDAHQALHILSAEVTAVDRAMAARLLGVKAAVERDFDQASAPQLSRDLPPLLAAARAALDRLGRSVPDPCG